MSTNVFTFFWWVRVNVRCSRLQSRPGPAALLFFGARIWLGTILGPFSINYFSGLGLRIRVRVWVMVMVRVWVRVSVGVGVRVSVVIWSG